MPVNHVFVSPVADEHNPNEVGPDEWNAAHTLPAHGELSGLAADDHPQYALDIHSFVTVNLEARLPNARTLVGTASVDVIDGGAGAGLGFVVDPTGVDHNSLLNLTVGDPHTQYIRKDLLTTTGDVIYASAAGAPARLARSVPAANVRNLLGFDNGDTVPTWKVTLDATAPTTIAAGAVAAAGTSLVFAHRDHTHGAPATFPPTAHALLDGSVNSDTAAHAPVRGDLIIGNSTPAWTGLAIGAAGAVLWTAGTDPAWTVNPTIAGYARVGSASAPTNTTAGDLTAVRVLAGDAALAAGVVLAAAGNATTTGYLRVGAATAPSNTTAGDLTALRGLFGNKPTGATIPAMTALEAASDLTGASGDDMILLSLLPTYTVGAATGNENRTAITATMGIVPTAASASFMAAMRFSVLHDSGAFNLTGSMVGVQINVRQNVAATTLTNEYGVRNILTHQAGSITTAQMYDARFIGAGGATLSTLNIYDIEMVSFPTTLTTVRGMNIPNLGNAAVTTAVGIDIAAQSAAVTTNFDIRSAGNTVHGGYVRVGAVTAPSNTTAGDLSSVRAVHGTDAAIPTGVVLFLNQGTLGNEVFRITSVATNDDPTESVYQNRVATTDATQTTLHTVTIPVTTTVFISATVVARRTGGTLGTAEDGAAYVVEAAVKNVAGVATLIGAVLSLSTMEDQALWDATITVTGATALLRVTGALSNNVVWHATIRVWSVGT